MICVCYDARVDVRPARTYYREEKRTRNNEQSCFLFHYGPPPEVRFSQEKALLAKVLSNCSDDGTEVFTTMTNLDQFQQDRRVLEDFTQHTLQGISGDISRLVHVATLRDLATGKYCHAGLSEIYSEPAVDQALYICHQELFERVLEMPLENQEFELRECLAGFQGNSGEIAARWREHEFYKFLIPSGMPDYLRKLFCSNIGILLQLIVEDSNRRPGA